MKDEAAFNVALVELAGHIPVKSEYFLSHILILNFMVE